jgi:hypothetical protein
VFNINVLPDRISLCRQGQMRSLKEDMGYKYTRESLFTIYEPQHDSTHTRRYTRPLRTRLLYRSRPKRNKLFQRIFYVRLPPVDRSQAVGGARIRPMLDVRSCRRSCGQLYVNLFV